MLHIVVWCAWRWRVGQRWPPDSFVHWVVVAAAAASWLERPVLIQDYFCRSVRVGLSSAVADGGIYKVVLCGYICPE